MKTCEAYGLDKVALNHVESVTVEHENQVQVSINKVMSYLKQVNIGKSKQICKQTADNFFVFLRFFQRPEKWP